MIIKKIVTEILSKILYTKKELLSYKKKLLDKNGIIQTHSKIQKSLELKEFQEQISQLFSSTIDVFSGS